MLRVDCIILYYFKTIILNPCKTYVYHKFCLAISENLKFLIKTHEISDNFEILWVFIENIEISDKSSCIYIMNFENVGINVWVFIGDSNIADIYL